MAALGFALAFAGFTAVCLSMDRHQPMLGWLPREGRTATALRTVGFALLAMALVACDAVSTGSNGVLLWFGMLTAAGISLIFILPYAPQLAAGLALIGPFAAALLSIVTR